MRERERRKRELRFCREFCEGTRYAHLKKRESRELRRATMANFLAKLREVKDRDIIMGIRWIAAALIDSLMLYSLDSTIRERNEYCLQQTPLQ